MARRRSSPPSPSSTIWRTLRGLAFGKLGWMIGAPLLVFSCGALLLWWSYVQHGRMLADVQARTTAHAQARLVDRYYLIERTDLASLPSYDDICPDLCQITQHSVAEVEFQDAQGVTHRAVFRDENVHDWQHNTPFELGVPVDVPRVKIAPSLHAWLVHEKATSGYETMLWPMWWERFDSAAHWLLRLREPVPTLLLPVRYDPVDPATVLLDVTTMRARQQRDAADARGMAWSLPVLLAVLGALIAWPAVQMMTYGMPKWLSAAVAVFIVVSVPWWAPAALRIAPGLSDASGRLAEGLRREFHGPYRPEYLAWHGSTPAGLETIEWSLATSRDAPFLAGFELRAPSAASSTDAAGPASHDRARTSAIAPLNHAGALRALQDGVTAQMRAMDDAALLAALTPLNHYQAGHVLELFYPGLLAIEADAARSEETRALASKLLAFFVDDFELPDVDHFAYEARLERYALLQASRTPAIANIAKANRVRARDLIARQQATMH